MLSTAVDYSVSLQIYKSVETRIRKQWLILSLCFNIGLLMFFKYFNFFTDSWVDAFALMGYHMDPWTIKVILPIGISFYTFQSISCTIDVYRKKLIPTTDFLSFAAFVSFFPQLVAGPIERATNMLPQMLKKRKFDARQSLTGIRLIIFGLFKKVVIADSLAPAVKDIFNNYPQYSGITLILGAVYFAFQIYCDFSGYSDIARGVANLLGFELMVNFNFPYLSKSIAEFWRKWHISLSTWFRDYLYFPLGGSRVSKWKGVRNIFIVFLVSGFWHGAKWTFVAWGGLHALYFLPSFLLGTNRKNTENVEEERIWSLSIKEFFQVLFTFSLVTLAWIFFRAESMHQAIGYFSGIGHRLNDFKGSLNYRNTITEGGHVEFLFVLLLLFILSFLYTSKFRNTIVLQSFTVLLIILFGNFVNPADFIYFQF
jgi:D-alanyl-lipoteichoic acid acyltransferase DltB (MBOAT superfamily)